MHVVPQAKLMFGLDQSTCAGEPLVAASAARAVNEIDCRSAEHGYDLQRAADDLEVASQAPATQLTGSATATRALGMATAGDMWIGCADQRDFSTSVASSAVLTAAMRVRVLGKGPSSAGRPRARRASGSRTELATADHESAQLELEPQQLSARATWRKRVECIWTDAMRTSRAHAAASAEPSHGCPLQRGAHGPAGRHGHGCGPSSTGHFEFGQ